jgi:hypothetical protein
MKISTLVSILIFLLAVLFISEGIASEKKVTKRDYRFVSGTWINEEYNSHNHKAKIEIHHDGTYDGYFKTADTGIADKYQFIIVEKWTDSEGHIWYKMHIWWGTEVKEKPFGYSLNKFSNSGKVWEWLETRGDFPTELDEDHFYYHIYYRQE